MPEYTIKTPDMERRGSVSLDVLESAGFPYHFLGRGMVSQFMANVPFSMIIIKYKMDSEDAPFRISILAPDFSMTTVLSGEEFDTLVRDGALIQNTTYELLYVCSGEYYQRIENTRHKYVENSCCLMNRLVRHVPDYHAQVHTIILSFTPDFLYSVLSAGKDSLFHKEKKHPATDLIRFLESEFGKDGSFTKKYIDFNPLPGLAAAPVDISALFDILIGLFGNPGHGSTLMLRAITYQVLTMLNNREYYDTTPILLGTPTESRLFSAITELMERSNGRISRAGLSEELNYSGNYLNRIVLKFSGLNISEYGNVFTMKKAAELLHTTEKPISEIALDLDISDRTHFYRLFQREFGMTPREYRLKNRG